MIGLEPVLVAKLPQGTFREMVRSHPDFTWALLTHLALQTRRMTERIYEFSTLVMRKRLVRELLRLAEPDGSVAARLRSGRPRPIPILPPA